MKPSVRFRLKVAAVVALLALAAGFLVRGAKSFSRTGEAGARVWFYDESERRLYAAPNDTVSPHEGVGGKSGDGVRAVVVSFRDEQRDPGKRRIAYLETCTPELKQVLEKVRAARVARQKCDGPIPSRDSDFFQANTLVKRPDDPDWAPINSAAGGKIFAEWRSWRGADGAPPVVCLP